MKRIAIVGKPNVGKSSLFNRILKQRDAITSDQAGTTRDVKKRIVSIVDKEAELIDTGGLDKGSELFEKIREKSLEAAKSADIILYMVDGQTIPQDDDKALFYALQKECKEIVLVVNKIDNDKQKERAWEYHAFGSEHLYDISVSHNRRVNALLEWVAQRLDDSIEMIVAEDKLDSFNDLLDSYVVEEEEDAYDESVFNENDEIQNYDEEELKRINTAIIGRVNVGKSSLLNALLGEERSVVSNIAGTTIDPIDESIEYEGKTITFIDTAGIRKRGKIEGLEKYALMRTKSMLENAHLALLVLDASEPFKELDEKIAGLVDENMLACIIVLNKWDLAQRDEYKKVIEAVRDRFKFLHYAPIITVSALTKQRIHKLYELIIKVNDSYTQRIPTSRLNEALEFAQRKHPIPSLRGQNIRLYYATQYDIRPPKIALVMNKPKGLHFTYRRYLTNQLRELFDFEGSPILFKLRGKGEKPV